MNASQSYQTIHKNISISFSEQLIKNREWTDDYKISLIYFKDTPRYLRRFTYEEQDTISHSCMKANRILQF